MMSAIEVRVTAEDIAAGTRQSAGFCPIALAIGRAAGAPADVGLWTAWVGDRHAELPPVARQFIERFDGGYPVEPIAFRLGQADTETP